MDWIGLTRTDWIGLAVVLAFLAGTYVGFSYARDSFGAHRRSGQKKQKKTMRIGVVPHPEFTEARVSVLIAELQSLLARTPEADPREIEPVVLAGGKAWASPNYDKDGQVVWTIYKPEDR